MCLIHLSYCRITAGIRNCIGDDVLVHTVDFAFAFRELQTQKSL